MKKTMKILRVLLLAIMLFSCFTKVFAAGTPISPADVKPDYSTEDGGLKEKAGKIMGMIRNAAAIAAVIMVMILGVKYMLGSAEEKSGYQKSFIPLIIGIVLVVAATQIATFIFNMAE